jgi:hypothetical protein
MVVGVEAAANSDIDPSGCFNPQNAASKATAHPERHRYMAVSPD